MSGDWDQQAASTLASEPTTSLLRGLLAQADHSAWSGELSSPNALTDGYFGVSVAISGKTIVVGAPDETASSYSQAGHAYAFNAKSGTLISTLTSPNAQAGGLFGESVAISGKTVVVGAPGETASDYGGAGHAYTFDVKTGALISTLTSPNAQSGGYFGGQVAISGRMVVVGATTESASGHSDAGNAYTFNSKTGALILSLTSPNSQTHGYFGSAVAISGKTIVIGASYETAADQVEAGHVYTFSAKTGAVMLTLTSPNAQSYGAFGGSVAISGRTIVVGAPYETVSSYSQAGHAYTFNARTGALISTLASPTPQTGGLFGGLVAISGRTVVVPASGETAASESEAGNVYVFNAKTGARILTLSSPNAQVHGFFGNSVAISGKTIVVGAPDETTSSLSEAGNAYAFNARSGALS